jgi:hypothetical protein
MAGCMTNIALLAQSPAPAPSRVTFELARLESFTHPLHWVALVAVVAGLAAYVVTMYRKDSVELHPAVGLLLGGLRILALVGLLAIYLGPQWRSEHDEVRNSRVLLLCDTSLSMGRNDNDAPSVQAGPNRADQVAEALAEGDLLRRLRVTHDVVVFRFDQDLARVASFGKLPLAGETAEQASAAGAGDPSAARPMDGQPAEPRVEWDKALAPRGAETRIGQALRQTIHDHRGGPVSGLVVFTDGGQNAGIDPAAAIELARQADFKVFPIGIGSDRQPVNVQVSDLLAPARAYPGDDYTVTGYIQAQGLAGKTVTVELASRPGGEGDAADPGQIEGTEEVTLGPDGEVVPVLFQVTPGDAGPRTLLLSIQAPAGDHNPRNNRREADIEVVDRQTQILLFAGGPSREYIFLRNLLFRDKDVAVDVLLQTAQPGISQDARTILDDFPSQPAELFEYDAIVAFDPNWEDLTKDQIDLLEQWVARQAGGLIVIAGPIYTDSWAQNSAMATIRSLYPVEFHRRFALLDDARFGSTEPWPIDFTRAGLEAEFLWLDDSGTQSQQAWASFPGVYGYYAVKGPKPAATVYSHYSDPRAATDGKPILMADQFYGSGRVFYLGTGEMWRLRGVDEAWFEQFYTKLIRHVSQGRLLRGSSRGVLLTERDRYLLGNSVAVRAQVSDAQLQPLTDPSVPLQVFLPDGAVENVPLARVGDSEGTYAGQFNVYQEGSYRLELPLPDSQDERLTRRIQVKLPDLESEDPRRNDSLLSKIAQDTGGHYFIGVPAAMGTPEGPSLFELLPDRRKTLPGPVQIDEEWEKRWLLWMMGLICGLLCLEWLFRRLAKLA